MVDLPTPKILIAANNIKTNKNKGKWLKLIDESTVTKVIKVEENFLTSKWYKF